VLDRQQLSGQRYAHEQSQERGQQDAAPICETDFGQITVSLGWHSNQFTLTVCGECQANLNILTGKATSIRFN
jgi:hypothetical protein